MLVSVVLVPRFVPEARADEPPPVDVSSAAMSLAVDPAARLRPQDRGRRRAHRPGRRRHRGRRWPSACSSCAGSAGSSTRCSTSACVRHPAVGPTLVVLFLTALLMGGSSLFFNLYLQEVQGLTPLAAAVWMLPQMVAMIAAANLGPLLTRRVSTHRVVVGMLTVMTTGFVCYIAAHRRAGIAAAGGARRVAGHLRHRRGVPAAHGHRHQRGAARSGPARARRWRRCRTSSASRSG